MHYTFMLLACCLFASNAVAQSEQERRRQHLPYVRAATDCIAQAVSRDPKLDEAVKLDSLALPIARAIDICEQPLRAMIIAHDGIYGSGGMTFFRAHILKILKELSAPDLRL